MRKPIISLLVLGSFLCFSAVAEEVAPHEVQIKNDAPERYVVEKGDTLWAISGKFLSEPWRWPEIWRMNKDEIKNPHRIFPGDVVVLDTSSGSPQLKLVKSEKFGRDVVLSPSARIVSHDRSPAIPLISPADIGPFLSQPLVIDKDGLDSAPEIVATEENRVIIGAGNRAYVAGMNPGPRQWQVFRKSTPLVDPDNGETLGYEAMYLGDARVSKFGETTTIDISRAVAEIYRGDRLVKTTDGELSNFVPHAPNQPLRGRIMSVYSGVAETGPTSIVTINRGSRDGIELGHVLAISRKGESVPVSKREVETSKPLRNWHQTECLKKDAKVSFSEPYDRSKAWGPCPENVVADKSSVQLPDERYGLMLVFRTFDRVSYALVMQASLSVHQGDIVSQP